MKKTTNPVKTIVTIVVGLLLVYFFSKSNWLLYLALSIAGLSLISLQIRNSIHFIWMKFSLVLSYIMPNVLLTIIFYLVLFPISLLSKVFGKNKDLVLENPKETTFKNSTKIFNQQSFEKPW